MNINKSELQNLMDDISKWSDSTFGNNQRNPAIVYHLKKEVDELIETFISSAVESPKNTIMRMEFADCMMLLVDSASHAGFTADDLLTAMREKLEINKKRKWGKPDVNGVVEHVSQPEKEEEPEQMEVSDNKLCSNCDNNLKHGRRGLCITCEYDSNWTPLKHESVKDIIQNERKKIKK